VEEEMLGNAVPTTIRKGEEVQGVDLEEEVAVVFAIVRVMETTTETAVDRTMAVVVVEEKVTIDRTMAAAAVVVVVTMDVMTAIEVVVVVDTMTAVVAAVARTMIVVVAVVASNMTTIESAVLETPIACQIGKLRPNQPRRCLRPIFPCRLREQTNRLEMSGWLNVVLVNKLMKKSGERKMRSDKDFCKNRNKRKRKRHGKNASHNYRP